MTSEGGLIRYVCVATHGGAPTARTPMVTIHEREWAYCRTGLSGGHTWQAIEPTTVERLALRPRPHEPKT